MTVTARGMRARPLVGLRDGSDPAWSMVAGVPRGELRWAIADPAQ